MAITIIYAGASTIRIHDELCDPAVEDRLMQLNALVFESYMRRMGKKDLSSLSHGKQ